MKQIKIKSLAGILSFFLYVGLYGSNVYSAAMNNDLQNYSSAITSEPITLRYFCALPSNTPKGISNLSELDFYKDLENETNIKISFIHPTLESQRDRYMLMMAAGDLPDLVEMPWTKYQGLLDRSVEHGAVLKLDTMIEKNASKLSETLISNKNLKRHITSDDGSIYQVPGLNLVENAVEYHPIIRKDLLDKLGLSIPKTIDEWEIVLKNFKDQKLTKSPLSFDIATLDKSNSFIGAYGVTQGFYIKDGRVVYGPMEKEYKDLLSTFTRWYKNGLLDPEFILLKNTQVKYKVNQGNVGAFIGTTSDLDTSSSALKSIDNSYELIPVQNPVLNIEDNLNITAMPELKLASGIVIPSMNKYPIETIKWLDYAYSKSEMKFNDKQMPNISNDFEFQNLQGSNNKLMPSVTLTLKENEEVSMIMKDMNTFCMEMFAKFVLGVEPLSNFDAYVDKMKRIGINKVINIYQTALYRYENRLTEDRIKISINGNPLEMDTNPVIMNDKPFIPVRFVLEALGSDVSWNEEDKSVTVKWNYNNILFKIDSTDVIVDNKNTTLDTAVFLLNNRTYIPADFLSQTLGLELKWAENAKSINIAH